MADPLNTVTAFAELNARLSRMVARQRTRAAADANERPAPLEYSKDLQRYVKDSATTPSE